MEEQDAPDEKLHEYSGSSQEFIATDEQSIQLPSYLAYLSLGGKTIATVVIMFMAGWIVLTIKTTRSLHKAHNVFVANLMATDAITALINLLLSGVMVIGYSTGMEDSIGCNVFRFSFFPVFVITCTYLMISIDKVITVTFPLRYHGIMKPQIVLAIIVTKWVAALILYTPYLFIPKAFTKVAKFGMCISNNTANLVILMTDILPALLVSFLAIILNIYLTIKAYQVHKQIQEESKLSGYHCRDNNGQLEVLKKKQATIKKHFKPIITLMVVVLGSSFFGVLLPLLFIPVFFLESSAVYEQFMKYVVAPNIGHAVYVFHPFVYGVYFKQVRKPMVSLVKRITCPCKCESATVAPQSQRRITNWVQ